MSVLFICLIVLFASAFAGAQWVQTNGLGGGIINDIVSDGTTLYAATFGEGVCRSDDYGVSWNRSNIGLAGLYMYTLAISEDMIFAATFRDGILLSTNKGNTWIGINRGLVQTQKLLKE